MRLVVLTGAGISAPSGVPTYRGLGSLPDEDRPNERSDVHGRPEALWRYYGLARQVMASVEPNPAHRALVDAAARADVTVVTQNVDDLHERAGSAPVHHLHGSLFRTRCDDLACPFVPYADAGAPPGVPRCPVCGDVLRPDVVLFGEWVPRPVQRAVDTAVAEADLLLAVGTTLAVTTASAVVRWARDCGVPRVLLTRDPDDDARRLVDEVVDDDVVTALPPLLDRLLGAR